MGVPVFSPYMEILNQGLYLAAHRDMNHSLYFAIYGSFGCASGFWMMWMLCFRRREGDMLVMQAWGLYLAIYFAIYGYSAPLS